MHVRIGSMVFSVNLLFLAVAFAFFLVLSYQRLYPGVIDVRRRAFSTLIAVSCAGIAGAWLYGIPALLAEKSPSALPPSELDLAFGSFGAYWGVILGSLLAAMVMRTPALPQTDAFIPGVLAGGAVARMADLFNNGSVGKLIANEVLYGFQPFRHWALYDIAAHLLLLVALSRFCRRQTTRPGQPLLVFLCGYGLARFTIECARATPHTIGPLTYGQIMSIAMVTAGAALTLWLRPKKSRR